VGSIVTPICEVAFGGGEEDVLLQAALRRNGWGKSAEVMSPALTTVTAAWAMRALSTFEKAYTVTIPAGIHGRGCRSWGGRGHAVGAV